MEIVNIVVLSLSSLLLVFVGMSRLFNPIKTYAKGLGIELPHNVDLLNEIRGVSAVMLCGGILTALGIWIVQLTFTSFIIAALIFLGFAMGRLMSIATDGKPNKQLIQGIIFELVLGGASIFCLLNM